MVKYCFVILCFLQSLPGVAQTLTRTASATRVVTATIDSIIQNAVDAFFKDSSRVGLSLGIYKNGTINTYNYGSLERNGKQVPSNTSLYEIGSITKTFTGVLLAQAVIDRKVKLDDDIRKYLRGQYPNLEYKGQSIKLFQLINHTSGIPFFLPDKKDLFQQPQDAIPSIIVNIQSHYSKERFLGDLHLVKLDTVPGTKFSYSNAAAQLLGYILESVYGVSYESLVKKYITIPHGMPAIKLTYSKKERTLFAKGYNGKGKMMPYNPVLIGAAGGIMSTVTDMLQYIKFHLNEDNPVIKLSHSPTFGDINSFAIGLNWQMNKTSDGCRRIWQSGGSFGFSSYFVVYPELNIGIILLSNEADRTVQGGLEEVAKRIFERLRNE